MPSDEDEQKRKQRQVEESIHIPVDVRKTSLSLSPKLIVFGVVLITAVSGGAVLLSSRGTQRGVNTNAGWTSHIEEFNGVQMALVPVGCFMMGSNNGESNEQPVHQQCFDEPFWIDVTEVTNAVYGSSGRFSGADRPREGVTWFEARDFCERRGARLPTEREWEYAARGPDGLTYPWGNTFNVVYAESSGRQTADVGSRLGGTSWVGALDMSGNVWEWVSSLYMPYEYDASDGREDLDNRADVRVLRGGSWFGYTDFLRAANRNGYLPTVKGDSIGFRCARS